MDADIREALTDIKTKLDKVYELQIATAQQEERINTLRRDVDEIKNNKKAWISPAISAAVSALVSWFVSGRLK